MAKSGFDVPILLIGFNRPSTTRKVFQRIREVRPTSLYIALDAPRKGNKKDEVACKEVLDIVSQVDWPCKVKKWIRKENLGCKIGESSAITWFFKHVEEGIILEDDNLADLSFFPFCKEMLERYRDDQRVMMISGNNFQRGWKRDSYSYYFSNYPHIWGWAGWRRSWNKYDIETKTYPELKKKGYFNDLVPNPIERKIMKDLLDLTYYKKFNTWDYQWTYSVLINNGLTILPNENLVRNVGMDEDAVHTNRKIDEEFSLKTKPITFPLKHPPFIFQDKLSDRRYFRWVIGKKIKNLIFSKTGIYFLLSKFKL